MFGGLNGVYEDTIFLDSSEVYSPADGWTNGAILPLMYGLRATNIDSRVLIFGKEYFGNQNQLSKQYDVLKVGATLLTTMTPSLNMTLRKTS